MTCYSAVFVGTGVKAVALKSLSVFVVGEALRVWLWLCHTAKISSVNNIFEIWSTDSMPRIRIF